MKKGLPLAKLTQSHFPMPTLTPVCLRHNLWKVVGSYKVAIEAPELVKKFKRPLVVEVPGGMLTDGTSVPYDVLEAWIGDPMEPHNLVWAVPHDVGFSKDCTGDAKLMSFDDWNIAARWMMEVDGVHGFIKRGAIYEALSVGGKSHFRKIGLFDTGVTTP